MDGHRLAYVTEAPVNWCPELGTVLANEEVVDGKSEVGGFPVVRRPMRQWMLRITAYADRLLEELEPLDWPESIKILQRNWIGRSEGAQATFRVDGLNDVLTVFTTRPDTLFGATYRGPGTRTSLGRSGDNSGTTRCSDGVQGKGFSKIRSRTH